MNRTRIALLGLSAVLVAVWVSSATLPPPAPPAVQPSVGAPKPARSTRSGAQPARDVTSFDLNEAAERLHARLMAAQRPASPARNPFEFAPAPAPRPVAMPAAPPMAPAMPVGPLPPPFALSGVAEHSTDSGTERTAILTGENQIYFAKAGDRVIGRYEVTAVGADAIELRELASGQTVRLGLR